MAPETDPNGGGNPNPGGSQGDKLFTQADVDRIVGERLKEDRKRRSSEGLSDEERTKFITEAEGLKTQLSNLRGELDTQRTKAVESEKAMTTMQRSLKAERIDRAIGAAAEKAGAIDVPAVRILMADRIRAREVTDDGKPTGQHVIEVKVERVVDGNKTAQWVSAEEGVKDFLAGSPYLVKSQTPPGAGTTGGAERPAGPPKVPDGAAARHVPGVGFVPTAPVPAQGTQPAPRRDLMQEAGDRLEQALNK